MPSFCIHLHLHQNSKDLVTYQMSPLFLTFSLALVTISLFPPSSSCPFQVSVCLYCLRERLASSEVTARQLGHRAAGVLSACVSSQMINVLFVTVSNYINELFIINAYTDTRWQSATRQGQSVCCQCRSVSEMWMSEENSRDRRSSMYPSCLPTLCEVYFRRCIWLILQFCLTCRSQVRTFDVDYIMKPGVELKVVFLQDDTFQDVIISWKGIMDNLYSLLLLN